MGMNLRLRSGTPDDAQACGAICYQAFKHTLKALIGAAKEFAGPGFLLPTRNGELFRWRLANGLRVTRPMTLMTKGLYNEPAGAFLLSILY
jgi:hypothetical protein